MALDIPQQALEPPVNPAELGIDQVSGEKQEVIDPIVQLDHAGNEDFPVVIEQHSFHVALASIRFSVFPCRAKSHDAR
ncbi:MAG: hypothetical protein WD069_04890 [Planctomycetales bacterium]